VAGIDMTNSEAFDDAMKFMDKLINEYEELQGSEINE
jgi:oligoendopeptidase F